jgi:hypothetical protein
MFAIVHQMRTRIITTRVSLVVSAAEHVRRRNLMHEFFDEGGVIS